MVVSHWTSTPVVIIFDQIAITTIRFLRRIPNADKSCFVELFDLLLALDGRPFGITTNEFESEGIFPALSSLIRIKAIPC